MDDLPPELHARRQEIHNKVVRRARALRHRRAAAMIAAIAIVVAIPTAAIALNSGGNSHGHARVAVSGEPTTEPATTSSTDATTTTIEATTTTPSSTANSTATTAVTQPAETSTTNLVCHNSMNPACGPLRYVPPITDQPATLTVKVSPEAPTVGETVTFTFHATDPDSRIEASDIWCNNGGYSFGDESTDGIMCETACYPVPGYGPWDPPLAQPSDVTVTLTHTYEKAGTFRAKFGMTAEPCGPRPSMTSTAVTVTVTATPPTS